MSDSRDLIEKRVAILGGFTTNNIKLILEIFLLNQGIKPIFYESEYNQYYKDAMFSNHKLEEFKPDIIYICTSNRNILSYPSINNERDVILKLIENEKNDMLPIW